MKTDSAVKGHPASGARRAVVCVGAASVRLEVHGDELVRVDLLPLGRRHAAGGALWDLVLAQAAFQVREYLQGKRKRFNVRLRQPGTPFQQEVWKALGRLPFGATCTYGELAASAGSPRASRAVGTALHRNRLPIFVPCHRVVAERGLGGFACGPRWKRLLLDLEKAPA